MLTAIFAGTFQTGSGLGKFCDSTLYRVSTFANNSCPNSRRGARDQRAGWRDTCAQIFPGANAVWAVCAGRDAMPVRLRQPGDLTSIVAIPARPDEVIKMNFKVSCSGPYCTGSRQLLARMRPTGRADQCPELEVEPTQRGRRLWAVHDPERALAGPKFCTGART